VVNLPHQEARDRIIERVVSVAATALVAGTKEKAAALR
jgi:hypothetical protein